MYAASPPVALGKSILWSLLIHLFLFVGVLVTPQFPFSSKPTLKVVWVELPRGASKTIDLGIKEAKDLPKTTIEEQKEALKEPEKQKETPITLPKPTAKKPEPKPQPKLTLEQKKIKEAFAALEKKTKQVQPEAAQIKDKGEGFKYGTGAQFLRVPPTDPEYIAYQAQIRAKIMDEWIIPLAYLEGGTPPKVRLVVMIDQTGQVVTTEWEARSGNVSFDASCQRAIQRASPLPTPPKRLEWEAYKEGFLVEFDPSLKVQ